MYVFVSMVQIKKNGNYTKRKFEPQNPFTRNPDRIPSYHIRKISGETVTMVVQSMLAMPRTMPEKYRTNIAVGVAVGAEQHDTDDPDEHDEDQHEMLMDHTDNSDDESHDSFDDDENVIYKQQQKNVLYVE